MGPHAVTLAEYGSFGTSVSLGSISTIEVLAEVRYPSDLANGPYPLVVMLHGRHATCYNVSTGAAAGGWPCASGNQPIPSYKGYDYAASVLASHGMIVASISANGINAVDNGTSTLGMNERGLLVQYHLGRWNTFATTGGSPFGTTFVGHVDLTRVGTMGHSRGGEGVVWNYEQNKAAGSPYGIQAVLPLAPVDFFSHFINNVPVAVLLGYCDGDVYELPGRGYVDDARYAVSTDEARKYTILALGANHDYFNRYWTPDQFAFGSNDDWKFVDSAQTDPYCGTSAPGNGRLTSAQQRGVGLAYMAAFFRKHLLGATAFEGILNGSAAPPPSAQTSAIFDGYIPGASDRRDLNRLAASSEISVNTLGAAAASSGLGTYALCGDGIGASCNVSRSAFDVPYNGLSSVKLWWATSGATYSNELPSDPRRDVSNFSTLQFRVAVDYSDAQNPVGQLQDFSIRLRDGIGRSSTRAVGAYTGVLYYPPAGGTNPVGGTNRTAVSNTARIPMSAFAGVDFTNIAGVDLIFNQKPQGGILLSDLAFADEGMTTAERWLVSSGF